MSRATLTPLVLAFGALALFASCGSDDDSSGSSSAAVTASSVPDEAPVEEDEPASAASAETTAPETTGAEVTAVESTIADTTSIETTPVETSGSTDVTDTTEVIDGPDVIDDTGVDVPDATVLPPVPTGSDVTPELCTTLLDLHEWYEEFSAMDEDNTTWTALQAFDAARTSAVLESYAELAELLPELTDSVEDATIFLERLSEVIQTADSYDEGEEMFLGDEDAAEVLTEQSLVVDEIDAYAIEECT